MSHTPLPAGWLSAKLGDCCEIIAGGTPRRDNPEFWDGTIPWITPKDISDIDDPVFMEPPERITELGFRKSSAALLPKGAILFSSRAPIGLVAIAGQPMATNQGFKSLVPGANLDSRFLYHAIKRMVPMIAAKGNGATFKEVSKAVMSEIEISFPKEIGQQRWIASILDRADNIRRKRKQAVSLIDRLLNSSFLNMFGDPAKNLNRWPVKRFGDFLTEPLRNGISPSSKGGVVAKVLTLSAITGASFDPTCLKDGMFLEAISEKDEVSTSDFYICRGNGNRDLVGKGVFATTVMKGVAFPDTIIAARPDPDTISKAYLEAIWKSPFVRAQIAASARTTNGTFKINQTAAESVLITLPPLTLQIKYQSICDKIKQIRKAEATALDSEVSLLSALSQSAFRGQLMRTL